MTRAQLLACAVAALALAAVAAGPARADGDPASDVLYTQPVFVPADAGVAPADAARLAALVREARRAGFPLKVAVVASSYDLGSVTALWRKPQPYAHFLGVELSLLYRGRLLTVMPNGLGIYHDGRSVVRERVVLRGVPLGGDLVATAATAVQRLAAANGHVLAAPSVPTPAKRARVGSSSTTWIGIVAGVLLVALAWAVSLRVRPPKRYRRA